MEAHDYMIFLEEHYPPLMFYNFSSLIKTNGT